MASHPRPEIEEAEYKPASANEENEVSRRGTVKRSRLKFRGPLLYIPHCW